MINVNHLTMKYPSGKGIEDVSFDVKDGEVMGYLGPNGAGKTTTIRCLLGFSKADTGSCSIRDLDCRDKAPQIQEFLGYIPGEIAFLDGMTGQQFLKFITQMRGTNGNNRMKELMEMFELDAKGKIKKYSKGMKQKIGIIAAFMHDPQVLILDEPTSGLDPLMQNRFIELILNEKKRGKTILLSSHIFEEVEKTCDRISIIKDGQIVKRADTHLLKQTQRTTYVIRLEREEDLERLKSFGIEIGFCSGGKVQVSIKGEQVNDFIRLLSTISVISVQSQNQSLEDVFLNLYGRGENGHETGIV